VTLEIHVNGDEDADLTERRRAAEESIGALVAWSTENLRRARAADAERQRLGDAVAAPLMRLVQEDREAMQAIRELQDTPLFEVVDLARPDPEQAGTDEGGPTPFVYADTIDPPYPIVWSWHDTSGYSPYHVTLDSPGGYVEVEARSGHLDGGAAGAVNAHAGFGVTFTATHTGTAYCAATATASYIGSVASAGVGGNATAEGTVEFTAFNNSQFIAEAHAKYYRKRVSGNEHDEVRSSSPVAVTNPARLQFPVQAGLVYTFNIGAWVHSDRSTGAGVAAARSVLGLSVRHMVVSIV
jgi:hypothetical protein